MYMPKMSPLSCLVHMKKSSYFNILCVLIRVGFLMLAVTSVFDFRTFIRKKNK